MGLPDRYKVGKIYLLIFGMAVVLIGSLEMVFGIMNKNIQVGWMVFSGYFMLWRGIILLFAGLFYIRSVENLSDIHQQAKAIVASMMIWIVGGMYIFSMFSASIPGGEDRWINTFQGFLSAYSPPYIPSVFLLPFSLFILYFQDIKVALENLSTGSDQNQK